MKQYYYLIAGLPDLTLDDGKLNYTVEEFKVELYPELSVADRKLVDLLYLKYDNDNLLKLLKDKDAEINPRGLFTSEELLELIESVKNEDGVNQNMPSYFYSFLTAYLQFSGEETDLPENLLALYYYNYAMKSKNSFVAAWFELNLNLNNILSALALRKYKLEQGSHIVGDSEISEAIRTSGARDFGLSGVLSYFEELVRISEINELVEREKKIDQLKWSWMENESFFNYFTIEKLFIFLIKLESIERWIALDKETGNQLFRQLIDDLRSEIQIPDEFRNK